MPDFGSVKGYFRVAAHFSCCTATSNVLVFVAFRLKPVEIIWYVVYHIIRTKQPYNVDAGSAGSHLLIRAKDSVLVVIDMQERLVPAMQAPARTLKNAKLLLIAAQECGVPVILTEQYPQGLGRTMPDVLKVVGDAKIIPKMHFSCMEDEGFSNAFKSLGRKQAVLAGMEAHICVVQSAASLIEEGYEVFVVSDATASRSAESENACLQRLSASGVGVVTTEMAVFEWLGKAGTPAFKKLLPFIKQ
jgi:nicotinamidase-related amidase